jgi:hypothetical protein
LPHPLQYLKLVDVVTGYTGQFDDTSWYGAFEEGIYLGALRLGFGQTLPERKRLAFCQMVYAASTFDYGLLMDSYKTIGMRLKKEDVG